MRISLAVPIFLLLNSARFVSAEDEGGATTPGRQDCNCSESQTTERGGGDYGYGIPPCHCLQQMWLDYPGSYDLYICRTYFDSCDEEGEEELWYGPPTNNHRPQECQESAPGECEPAEGYDGRRRGIPGHELVVDSTRAWAMVETALESASVKTHTLNWDEPEFHEIERKNIPEGLGVTEDIAVMFVPVSGRYPDGRTVYFGLQIDSVDPNSDDEITDAQFDEGELRSGKQFAISYRVNGQRRTGLVWLK